MDKHAIAEIMHHLLMPMGYTIAELGGIDGTLKEGIWLAYFSASEKNPKTYDKYASGYLPKQLCRYYQDILAWEHLYRGMSAYVHASTSILKMVHTQKAIYDIVIHSHIDPVLQRQMLRRYRTAPNANEIAIYLSDILYGIIAMQYVK